MANKEDDLKKRTDGSSIRPVSSLLSHFEALKSARSSSGVGPSLGNAQSKFLHQDTAQTTTIGRVSLDLPRPQSPWISPGTSNALEPLTPRRSPGGPLHRSVSPSKDGHKRPMSMHLGSAPQLTPSVTINSPRSPPRTTAARSGSKSPERLLATITPGKVPNFPAEPAQRSLLPVTPESAIDKPEMHSERSSRTSGAGIPYQPPPRASSIPPPVNRAEKPKISPKPKPPQEHETRRLTPEPIEMPENRVSPFSTPPGSEGSPSPERHIFVAHRPPPPDVVRTSLENPGSGVRSETFSTQSRQSQRDPCLLGFSGPTGSIEPRDPRSLGFSTDLPASTIRNYETGPARANTVAERSSRRLSGNRDPCDAAFLSQKPAQRHVSEQVRTLPPRTVPRIPAPGSRPLVRDPRQYGLSKANYAGSQPEGQARRAPPAPPTKESEAQLNNRGPVPLSQRSDRSTNPATRTRNPSVPSAAMHSEFPPPPRRTTSEESTTQVRTMSKQNTTTMYASKHVSRAFVEDSDEAEEHDQDLPANRSEYPDSSQANRRPPHFNHGAQELPTKFDSRVFDMCGQYICTTGYVTRAWDLSRGEQIFSLSHGETVKMISVAFKPAQDLKDEGSRLWIGSNIGELHEVDVATQAIVATSAVHNRREVIRILRQGKDLWTLDDEGKLFVWRAEEFRMPSLKYSHHAHRLPKGHTFSMTVRGLLWYATGKEIRILRPGDEASFSVLQKPLSQPGTGDITSGAYTSRQGGCIYLGHADGKVSIYTAKDYACIGVVKASDYKINAISFVGENLWMAYKTGKIYVYDTSCNPWKVKKDWRAHDGPTASMLLDPSSIWTMNRLQVASLGHDNCIRFWDGMLEEDWLESAMQSKDSRYCTFREIRATVVTWNVGACNPSEIRSDFLSDAIHAEDPPELLIFGFQETVDLEDKALTAKSIFGFAKKKEKENARSEQQVSRVYREWRDYLGKSINRYTDTRYAYTEVHTSCLIGLFQCIFVRQEERKNIRNVSATEVKCGMKGHYGNKGALVTRFMLDDSSLCFVNCHLAAGQSQTSHRNNDIATILEAESLPAEQNPDTRTSFYIGGGDGTQVLDHEICILNGDLNYRIDAIPRDTVVNLVSKGELGKLLERDQLMVSRRRVSGFRLSPFNEAPITFAPTYKYDVGSDKYDSSEKKRSPAWCDRVLYRGVGRIKQVEYRRHEIRVSDHRPVSGTFKIRVKTIDPGRREQTRAECHEQFGEVQRGLADEASIEYLVSSIGLTEKQARTAITDDR